MFLLTIGEVQFSIVLYYIWSTWVSDFVQKSYLWFYQLKGFWCLFLLCLCFGLRQVWSSQGLCASSCLILNSWSCCVHCPSVRVLSVPQYAQWKTASLINPILQCHSQFFPSSDVTHRYLLHVSFQDYLLLTLYLTFWFLLVDTHKVTVYRNLSSQDPADLCQFSVLPDIHWLKAWYTFS